MADDSTGAVVFISYSHEDEPDPHLNPGEIQWLSYVKSHFAPAVAHNHLEIWDDQRLGAGDAWRVKIEDALNNCALFILLVSRHSLSSEFILNFEMKRILKRRELEGVHIYPLVITSCDLGAAKWLKELNLKPPGGTALDLFERPERDKVMAIIAGEIREILEALSPVDTGSAVTSTGMLPVNVDIDRLPNTPFGSLVGRDYELAILDRVWADGQISIISLVAEGGTGKSSLVSEWLLRLQRDGYRGAAAVLGWSFYSQGSKERATSAEPFLNWALDKLGLTAHSTSASAKGEAVAEALAARRVLLLLDGVEPLQHGPGPQQGQLKDQGLRALLRRFAGTTPRSRQSLVVVTSRLAVADIDKWKSGAAPVIDLEQLSEEAGAALLKENGVHGTDGELRETAREFGGHALALALLASFLTELHRGDVRRRDCIAGLLADEENPGHGHARRVMQSYEHNWLKDEPLLWAILSIVGLFDCPASGDCLKALRQAPAIKGLTDIVLEAGEDSWRQGIGRLREVRLLLPPDEADPGALDAHPLVREWFGGRLESQNLPAWRAAHGRLYEHLRDTTKEGETPTLEDLAPLFQAIPHGCRAGRHQEALNDVLAKRVLRGSPDGPIAFSTPNEPGVRGSVLVAISWFFEAPFVTPMAVISELERSWVLGVAAFTLQSLGRTEEALPALRVLVGQYEKLENWLNASITAGNLCQGELLTGEIANAIATATRSADLAGKSGDTYQMILRDAHYAVALHAAGRWDVAENQFASAERREKKVQPEYPLLKSLRGYDYCDLLLDKGEWAATRDRGRKLVEWHKAEGSLLDIGLATLTLGRAHLGLALDSVTSRSWSSFARDATRTSGNSLDNAVEGLRATGVVDRIPCSHLSRAAFRRAFGDWARAESDLEEVEGIAVPGWMRLYLCDLALERARLAFARIEAFAPLNGLLGDSPPKPALPDGGRIEALSAEAKRQLDIARQLIADCGYHRRDEALAELDAVLAGENRFAELRPRV